MLPKNILICFRFTRAFRSMMTLILAMSTLILLCRQHVLEGCLWECQRYTFLCLMKVVFAYIFITLIWATYVVFHHSIDFSIIKIHSHTLVDVFLECFDHYFGEYGWGILQSKGHFPVCKWSKFTYQSCFVLVLFCNGDLVIPWKSICKWVAFMTCYFI